MTKRGNKLRLRPRTRAILLSAALALAVLLLTVSLGGLAISKEWLPRSSAAVIGPLAVLLAALLGPIPLQKSIGRRPMPVAYAFLGGLLAVLVAGKLLVWPDAPIGSWTVPAAALAGATAAGLLGSRRPKRRR